MEDYLNGIDESLMRSINKGSFLRKILVIVGIATTSKYMVTQGKKMRANDKRCMYELRGALP